MIIKNQRVLLHRHHPGPDDVAESFNSYQKFIAKLLAGVSIVVRVEMSMNGSTDWQEICTFTLDTPGEEIDTGLLAVSMPYVRANVLSQRGSTPSGIIYMGD